MGSSSEGPNPLRPYYIPPSIGLSSPSHPANNATSSASGPQSSIGNAARDIFSDLDYTDYLGESSPSIADSIKELVDKALWKYSSVLMAQPFEVAKTILQVYLAQDSQENTGNDDERRQSGRGQSDSIYGDVWIFLVLS